MYRRYASQSVNNEARLFAASARIERPAPSINSPLDSRSHDLTDLKFDAVRVLAVQFHPSDFRLQVTPALHVRPEI